MSEERIFIDSLIDISNEIDRILKFINEITYDEFIHDERQYMQLQDLLK